eukprot:1472555-Karenia_brevis.AAC.1
MDMSPVQEQAKRLRALLVDQARVAEPLAEFIMKEMGCESVSDFAGLFKASDYETDIETSILQKVDALKDNMVQLSRLRTAWKLSVAEFE